MKLSHGSLARIERGQQRVSVGMLGVLCEIYEVAPLQVAVGADQTGVSVTPLTSSIEGERAG